MLYNKNLYFFIRVARRESDKNYADPQGSVQDFGLRAAGLSQLRFFGHLGCFPGLPEFRVLLVATKATSRRDLNRNLRNPEPQPARTLPKP